MRAWIIASVMLAATGAAHAGRRTTTFDLVGWSADGKSAMFTRTVEDSDKMGRVFGYVIVTASESKPVEITTLNTLAEQPNQDASNDRVDAAACNKLGGTLAKVIATKKFKGLMFEKNECTGTMRTVVHSTSNDVGKTNVASWIVDTGGSKAHNPPTKREAAALAAAASITPGHALIAASPTDGTLVVVFYGGTEGEVFAYFNKDTLVAKDL
ncbi:MAG TPA: hypothetical protein VH143_12660 [Kofleriaceae bacterium]|jgi:hypothetical protein|nr:hypothetical protein [Kofleriaceae bacterium]